MEALLPAKTAEEKVERGVMKILSTSGDDKISWDPRYKEEVEFARKQFDELLAKGYLAFSIDKKDKTKGQKITEFTPLAGEIIMTPPMRGG
jgi:hypothetical protein